MNYPLTPGADRCIKRAVCLAEPDGGSVGAVHLLQALLLEQVVATRALDAFGINLDMARQFRGTPDSGNGDDNYLERLMDLAAVDFRMDSNQPEVQSEHLLCGLLQIDSPLVRKLMELGLTPVSVRSFFAEEAPKVPPIEVDFLLGDDSTQPNSEISTGSASPMMAATDGKIPADSPSDHPITVDLQPANVDILRIIDAAANRLREGLRVLDDYVRFVLNDPDLTNRIKQLRHRSAESCHRISPAWLQQARDTPGDIGTSIHTSTELHRKSLGDVVTANLKRTQESARSLEEFGKLIHPEFALEMKQLRYDLYILESSLFEAATSVFQARPSKARPSKSIADCRLYVLVSESGCRNDWRTVVQNAVCNGVDVIQLREKQLADRELIDRARWVRQATLGTDTLFIVNDRADIAAMVDADGVHVGQEEATVADVRAVLGPDRLVGVSTHSVEQARQAVCDGADYIGVGPVFPSTTKPFAEFPGLDFLKQVSSEIPIPGFAIGGVTLDNLNSVIAAGGTRIAVAAAVCNETDIGGAVARLKQSLAAIESD